MLARFGRERRTLPELQDQLFFDIGNAAAKQSRFWVLLILSTVIATAGVLSDSTATVIGAMIVAPLGTPIMAVGLGVVIGDARRIATSVGIVAGGVALVIVASAIMAWILPQLVPLASNGQVTGRTSPETIDLVAAVATGFAGAYGLARKDVSDVMPGVAIAISLVPPLAVVGVTAQAGAWASAWGAFLLFASNAVAMVLAGTILFTRYGYHGDAVETPGFRRRRAYVAIMVSVVAILVPLIIATRQTVRLQLWKDRAAAVAQSWAASAGYKLIQVGFQGQDLVVLIEGAGSEPSPSELLNGLAGELPKGTPVTVNSVSGRRIQVGKVPSG
jgi:uncharacterized hydrophobic protein (TIGR00341 family)